MVAGMKASPRFRESVANIRLRHQPSHIKYPLLQLHIVSNPDSYEPRHLNVRRDVSIPQRLISRILTTPVKRLTRVNRLYFYFHTYFIM